MKIVKRRVTRSIVPNMFTLVNLFAGFTAIIYIAKEEYVTAALFILVASIFDMLDGVMARLVRATSEFGAELDSLCDAVSFGVAPAFMLYKSYFHIYDDFGIFMASLPALAGVVRLARFNVKLSSFDDKLYFHGLPIPSSALTLVSFVIFIIKPGLIPDEYLAASYISVTVVASLAMVSNIRFDNLPRPTKKSFMQRPVVSIIFYIGVIACVVTKGGAIFPFMMFYIVVTSVRDLINRIRAIRGPVDDIDETGEDEPSAFDI